MALPLPKVVPDVGPGGGLVTAMGGINALNNALHTTRYNKTKADYAGLTIPSQAYSQLAYANAVAPQILAKLMGNEGALANMSEEQKKNMLAAIQNAGFKNNNGLNLLPQGQAPGLPTGSGQPTTNNFSGHIQNAFKKVLDIFGVNKQQQPTNPLSNQALKENNTMWKNPNAMNLELTGGQRPVANEMNAPQTDRGINNINDKELSAYDEWLRSQDGQNEMAKGEKGNYPTPQQALDWQQSQHTYAENTGHYKSTVKRLEKGGEYQAQALNDIGKSQLSLSGQGAALDEMTKIITNPIWQNARATIPAFQSQQLSLLKVTGSPEMKKLAGEYTSAGQAIITNAVAAMGSKHLSREYSLAEKQKINDSDTIESSEGKITNAKNLHDIAEKKNVIIKNLLKQGVDEADAVEQANKEVDVTAIRRATDKLLERKISITNNKTGKTETVSIKEAQKRGVPNV